MSVDDSAARRLPHWPVDDPVPWGAREAGQLMDIFRRHAEHHPEAAVEAAQALADDAARLCRGVVVGVQIPQPVLYALRTGGEVRYPVQVHGQPVWIIVDQVSEPPHDTTREHDIWTALQHVVATAQKGRRRHTCDGFTLHDGMPREVALAYWEQDGHAVYVCRPGVNGNTLRRTRGKLFRQFMGGLPIPLSAVIAVTDKFGAIIAAPLSQAAGAVAAVGLIATASLPALPDHAPHPAVVALDDAHRPGDPGSSGSPQRPSSAALPSTKATRPGPRAAPTAPDPDPGQPSQPAPSATAPGPSPSPLVTPAPTPASPALPAPKIPRVTITPTKPAKPHPKHAKTPPKQPHKTPHLHDRAPSWLAGLFGQRTG